MEKGKWNHLVVVYGPPQCGKTYYAIQRLRTFARTPAWALAHDPHWNIQEAARPLTLHEVQAELRRPMRPGRIIALPTGGDEAAAIAKAVGVASLTTREKHPVMLMLDEGAAVGGFNPYRLGDAMRDLITQRRHYHVGIMVTLQSAAMGHYSLSSMATEIVVFKTTSQMDLKALEKSGFPDVARATRLPQWGRIVWSPQSGEVRREDKDGRPLRSE